MKNAVILAKKSTWTSRLDIDYLDENSELKQKNKPEKEKFTTGQKLKQFSDYASKETIGQVYPGGFLHFKVGQNNDGTFIAPAALPNEERKRRITQTWHEHLKKNASKAKKQVIQHRLIFSMSKPMHDALVAKNLNPDTILHQSMKQVMRKFQEKFHKGDSIGYSYGFHHDTKHLHLHVALCPRTLSGKYVGCSTSRNPKISGNKDQLGFIRKQFESQNEKWGELLKSPEKLAEIHKKGNQLKTDKILFVPKLNPKQLVQLKCSRNLEAFQLQQTFQKIENLKNFISKQRQDRLKKANSNFIRRLCGIRKPIALKFVETLAKNISKNRFIKAQKQLFQLERNYISKYRNYQKMFGDHYASRNAYYYAQQTQRQVKQQRIGKVG